MALHQREWEVLCDIRNTLIDILNQITVNVVPYQAQQIAILKRIEAEVKKCQRSEFGDSV